MHVGTVLLTFTSGAIDITCYLALGKVFASVMTGNMVLLGLAAGTSNATLASSAGLAFAGYGIGTAAGPMVTNRHRSSVLSGLCVELALLAAFTAVWEVLKADPGVLAKHILVVARPDTWAMARLFALIAGAALTALFLISAPTYAPALPLAALALVVGLELAHVARRPGAGGSREGSVGTEGG
jgi:hypothetical protein